MFTPPASRMLRRNVARPVAQAALCLLVTGVGCDPGAEPGGPDPGDVTIAVAPLDLADLVDATYRVSVANGGGDVVWSRDVGSAQFGDGAGGLSYVGSCDAASNPNRVSLALLGLRTTAGDLVDGLDFANPAPIGDPLVAEVTCLPNQDVPVSFDLTVAVAARQGFFDIAISFDDIFCSAKLDCLDEEGELELLHNPLTGARDQTVVLGFACTAGPEQDTHLWMDPVVVTCDGGGPFGVNVAGGPGNLDPPFPGPPPNTTDLLFQAAIYRGVEALGGETSWNKAYWNVALGLNDAAFPTLSRCVLRTAATASAEPFVNGATPAGVRWPMVTWDVTLVDGGALVCASHALDDGTGVATTYTPSSGHTFYASFRRATGEVDVVVGTPDATTLLACEEQVLDPGQTTHCSVTPRQYGAQILASSEDFSLSAAPGGALTPLSPEGLATTFAFDFTAPATAGPVVIDSGVGATLTVLVLGTPDATSTISCADASLPSGGQTLCTIGAMAGGSPVYARASAFTPSASPAGTAGAINEAYGTSLTFTYTAGAATGPMTIGNGLGATTTVTVVGIPDATTTIACADAQLPPGGQTTCTITPRAGGATIYAAASAFDVSASPDGTTGPLSPTAGTSFTFLFTASPFVGVKTIATGVGASTTVEVVSDTPIEELTLPGKPTITDGAGQDAQIWLAWLPPSDSGGSSHLFYRAVCTPVAAGAPGETSTPATEGYVTGLQNGQGYTCVVYAANELGYGPPSDPTTILTPQAVEQPAGVVVAAPVGFYDVVQYDDAGFFDGVVTAGPASDPVAFTGAAFDSGLGAPQSGSVVAPQVGFYSVVQYDDAGVFSVQATGLVDAPPLAFAGDRFDSGFGAPQSGSVVAPTVGFYDVAQYDDAGVFSVQRAGVVAVPPVVFAGDRFDSGFGAPQSGSVVAPTVGFYDVVQFDDAGVFSEQRAGVVAVAPVVFTGANFDSGLGSSQTGATVAFAVRTVGRPYVYGIDPVSVSRGAVGPTELTFTGIGFTPVVAVSLYEPGGALSALVTVGSPTIDDDTTLTVLVDLDPSAPTGTWTASVVTGSGIASPALPPGSNVDYDNTFTVTN